MRTSLVGKIAVFGAIGGVCFVIDVGLYNLLFATVLADRPLTAKIVAALVATAVAWVGNRSLTFRSHRSRDRAAIVREAVLFAVVNLIGIAIATTCLFVSHYLLGFHSVLADNIAGNGVGLVLGTAFRYAAYSLAVFRPRTAPSSTNAPAAPTLEGSASDALSR
jgi:putative flippase GtrA